MGARVLLDQGMNNDNTTSWPLSQICSLGFGEVNSETMIGLMKHSQDLSAAGVIFTVLVANAPQILLSFLCFAYNGTFTCMLLVEEWNAYAHKRKFLRATPLTGGQRSTYRF